MSFWEKQVALVTGGTRGIGRAIAIHLASLGAEVWITGRGDVYEPEPGIAGYIAVDLTKKESLDRFLEKVRSLDGLTILINNAGINEIHDLCEFPIDRYDQIQEVNVRAPFRLIQEAAANMIDGNIRGRIVNIASIWATHTKRGRSAYCTAKAGILGMTRAASTDLAAHDILVNAVSPGFIQTELTEKTLGPNGIKEMSAMVPLGRLGKPEEIAKIVTFLVSEQNTFLTGQNIIVDGGFTNV